MKLAAADDEDRDAGRLAPPHDEDLAHVLRLMRLLLTAVDYAGEEGLRLTRDSAVVALARSLVGAPGSEAHSSRTALMALRDLVWRVDTARVLISAKVSPETRDEVDTLLGTDDIHDFLAQER